MVPAFRTGSEPMASEASVLTARLPEVDIPDLDGRVWLFETVVYDSQQPSYIIRIVYQTHARLIYINYFVEQNLINCDETI